MAISGGPADALVELKLGGSGSWNRDGVVLFTADDGGINRIAESGGNATPITTLDSSLSERSHLWPQFLPDGKHFLYFAESSKAENAAIYVASLDSKDRKLVLKASSNPLYVSPGYLLFHRQGTLMAQQFDADRLQLEGDAVPIAESVDFNPFGSVATFSPAGNK